MNLEDLVGQTLDGKYFIEKELGRGGMGAVYLSTHIGTERPVAVKVIVPQFMERPEFVERFKREARAAGRLRHPNVVDVTDFGFADTPDGRVAYLVMEYLDGCTLGEILEEEKQLPLSWTLDILEQVCSAVHEAHQQGIIHRDLKPDNVWLEPNQRGGYTVKVLDFGIAKLEAAPSGPGDVVEDLEISIPPNRAVATIAIDKGDTMSGAQDTLIAPGAENSTMVSERHTLVESSDEKTLADGWLPEGATILQPLASVSGEGDTAILSAADGGTTVDDKKKTQLISSAPDSGVGMEKQLSTSQLTRVGSVLGTPLYMSPEQCRGEKLDARSDIYSLAVIAYQMLSGKTPYTGSFTEVMDAHQHAPIPPLEARKIRKRVKVAISSSLEKDPAHRPETAEAFANKLRAHSEGIGALLRRSLVIYSDNISKFLFLALLMGIPAILLKTTAIGFSVLRLTNVISESVWILTTGVIQVVAFFVQIFVAALLVGTTTWIVAQLLAVPLKPVNLRSAIRVAKSKWKSFAGTVTASTLMAIIGLALCFFPGVYLSARFMLITPAIMMEGLRGRAAFRRSHELVKRSFRTVFATALLVYFVPGTLGLFIGLAASGIASGIDREAKVAQKDVVKFNKDKNGGFEVVIDDPKEGPSADVVAGETNSTADPAKVEEMKEMKNRIKGTLTQIFVDLFTLPVEIFMMSLTPVITALLYFKTRQAGGESMDEFLSKFEDSERPPANWQRRIRDRLVQSGRVTSNPT